MLRHYCALALLIAAPACLAQNLAQDRNPFPVSAAAASAAAASASQPASRTNSPTLAKAAPKTTTQAAPPAGPPIAPSTSAAPFVASAPLNLVLKDARWFDGQGFKRNTLYVVDGKFTTVKPKRVNRSMDLKDQFLVPPLADAHNYNLQNDWAVGQYAQRYVRDGVFYAAMMCADAAAADAARKSLEDADGPEALFVTACITSGDGQPLGALLDASPGKSRADFIDKAVIVIDKPDDVARKWPLVMAGKPTAIRLMLVQSDRPELHARGELWGRLGVTPEVATAITQRAHKAGLHVIAHVETAADFANAVKAGVDWIDHVPGFVDPLGDPAERFALTPEMAADAAKAEVSVVTGVAAAKLFNARPELQTALAAVLKRNLQTLKDAGVTLLLGSDLFTDTAQAELRALAATGVFSNAELLRMATITTPRALFPKRRIGCFETGCEASFLLLGADPTADLQTLAAPMLRAQEGRLLTQNLDVAEKSDESSISTDAAKKKASAATKGSKSTGKSGKHASSTSASSSKSSAKSTGTHKAPAKTSTKTPAKSGHAASGAAASK